MRPDDPALAALARIVHGADFPEEIDATPESAGLWAISQGFTDVSSDDAEILERAAFLYDSLYAHLRRRDRRSRARPCPSAESVSVGFRTGSL